MTSIPDALEAPVGARTVVGIASPPSSHSPTGANTPNGGQQPCANASAWPAWSSTAGRATPLLDGLAQDTESTVTHQIEIHKLRALAARGAHGGVEALDQRTQAMQLAALTGHRQTFIDERDAFGALLHNAIACSGHWSGLDEQPAKPTALVGESGHVLVEPLTGRELDRVRREQRTGAAS